MNEQKLKGALGLATRARQVSTGMDACRILIRSGTCGLMLLDGGTGPNTRRKAEDLCRRSETPVWVVPAGLIEEATGKSNMVLGIRNGSFSERIAGLLQEAGSESGGRQDEQEPSKQFE